MGTVDGRYTNAIPTQMVNKGHDEVQGRFTLRHKAQSETRVAQIVDSRLRGNDMTHVFAVIPAKAGIHRLFTGRLEPQRFKSNGNVKWPCDEVGPVEIVSSAVEKGRLMSNRN